jgi:predicted ATPase/signal transduction histidine kinase/ActR/RegA family two-component response regulator
VRIAPRGYRIVELIHTGSMTLVYRAERERDHRPVVLKMLERHLATPSAAARYQHEFELLDSLRIPGVIEALGIETVRGAPMLVLDDFNAQSVARQCREERFNLKQILALALRVTAILGEVHDHDIIHCDINPSNILFNRDTGDVKLADFGWSVRATRDALAGADEQPRAEQDQGGTLAYMSPEQTGRLDRRIDHRTDFYSLGVTLYELCTGRLPFNTGDPLALVHSHLAHDPVPPHEVVPDVPVAVSDIIMKLMSKMPEDRYQTAHGCVHDLSECKRQLDDSGDIQQFPLGRKDHPEQFHIPSRLYGREQEIATMRATLARVTSGARQLLLVTGHPGIGKSALIRELGETAASGPHYFLEGKYDQYRRNIPYSALVQAFSALVRQLLTESEERLDEWRRALSQALGASAHVLIEVIPELAFLIGPQPIVPRIGPSEAENRFNHAFRGFVEVLCRDHPVIVFLDDLHWSDAASLRLMKLMLTDLEGGRLLIVGSYRDREVDAAHPLTALLDQLGDEGLGVERISLRPLELDQVSRLLADTLRRTVEDCAELAELVMAKTAGNPFFVKQFLLTLHHDQVLELDRSLSGWRWDLDAVRGLAITDNVVDLMVVRMRKLPMVTQRTLQLAASAGNVFDTATLAIICEDSPTAINDQLAPVLDMGMIRLGVTVGLGGSASARSGGSYAFSHDRVQQAAYALIPGNDEAATHLKIARLLERALPDEEREARVFELAEHFALAAALIDTKDERLRAARLCLAAGRRAKESMAHESARRFLGTGLAFMPEESWRDHYELMRDLTMAAAEVEYVSADVDAARRVIDDILDNARDLLDRAVVRELQMTIHIARQEMSDALEIGLDTLSMLGVSLPREPEAVKARLEELRGLLDLSDAGLAAPEAQPVLTDPHQIMILRILDRASPPAFYVEPMLWPLMTLTGVTVCMRHGHSALAAVVYINFASMLCGANPDIGLATRLSALALRLVERFPDPSMEVRTSSMFHAWVRPWIEPDREAVERLRALVQRGLQAGDLEHAAYASLWCPWFRFQIGDPLEEVHRDQRAYLALVERHGMVLHRDLIAATAWITSELLGRPAGDEQAVLQVPFVFLFQWTVRAALHNIMGNRAAALDAAERSEEYVSVGMGLPMSAEQHYAYCLAVLGALTDVVDDPERSRALLAAVERKQASMRAWAERMPENFAHKHALVAAEHARVRGESLAAMALYDEAIEAARASGYAREEAVACERAASFYAGLGRKQIGDMYLSDAHLTYRRWGARAKVMALEQQHPWLAQRQVSFKPASQSSPSSSGGTRMLDLESVVRASQALSSQLVLDQLLAKLMKIIIENAGAQRGYLLLTGEDRGPDTLTLEAEGDISTGQFRALPSLPPDHPEARFARTAVSYVSRTRTSLVLSDAASQDPYANDPYVRSHALRSLLCAPVTRHGELVGLIYLENNRATDAFTPGRLEVVQTLATQAAISIENARLLRNLEWSKDEAEQAREAAERANLAKSEFLANINHELRTPMNGIIGTIELLLGMEMGDEPREYLIVARTAAEQLMRIIRDTLDVSRIEAGKLDLEPIRFSLDECLATLTRMLSVRMENSSLSFSLEVADGVPNHLVGDRDRLLQLLVNLLGNAIKFTPSGGDISLRLETESRGDDGVSLRFEVSDTGIGIPADVQEAIFEPFTQVRAPGLGSGGSGLGLAIASSLVRMMRGTIGVESELGQGSRFWFTARFGEWDPEATIQTVAETGTGTGTETETETAPSVALRILVAEDNRVNQLVAARLLEREGHACMVANNGLEALQMIESDPIDVVLMDVHMPVMDGYAATREIRRREHGGGRRLPIIAVTASATTDVVEACKASGMDHYLSKPLRIDSVRELLRTITPSS